MLWLPERDIITALLDAPDNINAKPHPDGFAPHSP